MIICYRNDKDPESYKEKYYKVHDGVVEIGLLDSHETLLIPMSVIDHIEVFK
jgi:hypothetical protein